MDKSTFQNNVLEAETTMYRISMSMLQNEADCADAVSEAILKALKSCRRSGMNVILKRGSFVF